MAIGLLLGVSWIFLLFSSNLGLPATKGVGYPVLVDSNKLPDPRENEVLLPPTFEKIKWHASAHQPTDLLYRNYIKPSVFPLLDSMQQNYPNTQSASKGEMHVNDASGFWGPQITEKSSILPKGLNSQLGSIVKPELGGNNVLSPAVNFVYEGGMPVSQSTSDSLLSAFPVSVPHFPPHDASPSFELWVPEAVGVVYGMAESGYTSPNHNVVTNVDQGQSNIPHLVFEEVFNYPTENSKLSHGNDVINYPAKESNQARYMMGRPSGAYRFPPPRPSFLNYKEAWNSNPFGMGFLSYPGFFGHRNFNFDRIHRWQNPLFSTFNFRVPQRVIQPIRRYQRSTFRIKPIHVSQSRNYYQKGRYNEAKTMYSPQYF